MGCAHFAIAFLVGLSISSSLQGVTANALQSRYISSRRIGNIIRLELGRLLCAFLPPIPVYDYLHSSRAHRADC